MSQSGRESSLRVVKVLDLNENRLPVCELAVVLLEEELFFPPVGVAAAAPG